MLSCFAIPCETIGRSDILRDSRKHHTIASRPPPISRRAISSLIRSACNPKHCGPNPRRRSKSPFLRLINASKRSQSYRMMSPSRETRHAQPVSHLLPRFRRLHRVVLSQPNALRTFRPIALARATVRVRPVPVWKRTAITYLPNAVRRLRRLAGFAEGPEVSKDKRNCFAYWSSPEPEQLRLPLMSGVY
jgi:hypothetical protein